MNDSYLINLGFFNGPMDLLLHLVQQQEVAIEDVEMVVVAEQYLELVCNSELLDMERASEYLVIAATLLAIKSQSILPSRASDEETVDSDYEDSDYLERLREQLKAYELTKNRASALIESPQLGVDTFSRCDRKALQPDPEELSAESIQLGDLFIRLLKRVGGGLKRLSIRLEPISVMRYMMQSIDVLKESNPPKSLFSLAERFLRSESKTSVSAKGVVIGSLISTLELVRRGWLRVEKTTNGDYDLELALLVDDADTNSLHEVASEQVDSEPREVAIG